GGAEESDDQRTAETEDHPTGVGFERVVADPTPEDRRPKHDTDDRREHAEREEQAEGFFGEAGELADDGVHDLMRRAAATTVCSGPEQPLRVSRRGRLRFLLR